MPRYSPVHPNFHIAELIRLVLHGAAAGLAAGAVLLLAAPGLGALVSAQQHVWVPMIVYFLACTQVGAAMAIALCIGSRQ
jgi:hypothetical protein